MTARPRMTVKHAGDSVTLALGDEPKSAVLGRYKITVEPMDAPPTAVQASGGGGLTCDEVLQQMGSA